MLRQYVRYEGRPIERWSRRPFELACGGAVLGEPRTERGGAPLTPEEQRLVESILRRAAVDPKYYRSSPMRRRMPAVLRAVKCNTVRDAARCVEADPLAARKALNSLVIGHSTSFRDVGVFESLRNTVLPRLGAGPLRVWSIGCSRGFELLSVALLLAERGQLEASTLRGSDCRPCDPPSDPTLSSDFVKSIPDAFAELRASFGEDEIEAILKQIEWRTEDALGVQESACWDLVLCRNISIYLTPEATRRLWSVVASALRPGGILVTGKAERPALDAPFCRLATCIYLRGD